MDRFDAKQGQAILDRISGIPIFRSLKFRIIEFAEGFCEAWVPHDRAFDGVYGSFHGGLLATVADSVACFAIMTITGPDEPLTTTDFSIRFLAPCLTDVTARAQVIKVGKTLCPVGVDLYDAKKRHVAVAQVTYIRLGDKPRHAPGPPEP
ncbi:MAG: PaaI family thioesterase [Phycisphaerae bacterium]